MAAATATQIAAAGGPGGDINDVSPVYNAVSSGASEEELRRVIEECAQGDNRRRVQAVNHSSTATETPLQAAHRQKRGDLVGALVEAGADVGDIFGGRTLTPFAVCIAYGQVESVRALLRAGHDVNEKIDWSPSYSPSNAFCTPIHFCLAPPPLGLPSDRVVASDRVVDKTTIGAPQIGCLEVLLRERGVQVDARDSFEATPIIWLAQYGSTYDDDEEKAARDLLVSAGVLTSGVFDKIGWSPLMVAAEENHVRLARSLIEEAGAPVDERDPRDGCTALHFCKGAEMAALLLDAGAAVNALANDGGTPLFQSVGSGCIVATCLLLDRGASVDVVDEHGCTPLIMACHHRGWLRDEAGWPLFQEILRRSSAETRRAQLGNTSAVDILEIYFDETDPQSEEEDLRVQKRCCWAMAELQASGAPLRPDRAAPVLPIAASLSAGQHAELVARRAALSSWRAHETFVGLSLDVEELWEAEREAEERRARVAALELELQALGSGTDDGSGSDGDSSSSSSGISSGEGDDEDGEESSEGEGETEDDAESESEIEGAARAATGDGGETSVRK